MVGRELQHCQPGVLDYDKEEEVLRVENVSYKKYGKYKLSVYKGKCWDSMVWWAQVRDGTCGNTFGINQPDSGLVYSHGEETRTISAMMPSKRSLHLLQKTERKRAFFRRKYTRKHNGSSGTLWTRELL